MHAPHAADPAADVPVPVPVRSRAVLACGLGLAGLTVLAVVVATVLALVR